MAPKGHEASATAPALHDDQRRIAGIGEGEGTAAITALLYGAEAVHSGEGDQCRRSRWEVQSTRSSADRTGTQAAAEAEQEGGMAHGRLLRYTGMSPSDRSYGFRKSR